MRKLLFIFCLISPLSSPAFFTEINGLYLSDSLSATSDSSISRMYGDLAFGIDLTNKGPLTVGWSVLMISASDSDTSEVSYSTFDMGPKLTYFIDRAKYWSLGFVYNLQATATYKSDSTEATWRGTSMKFEMGYAPQLTETISIGLKLNYYTTTLTEEFDSSDNYTEITNTRTTLWPSLYVAYRLD